MTENLSHLTAPDTPIAIIGLGYVLSLIHI